MEGLASQQAIDEPTSQELSSIPAPLCTAVTWQGRRVEISEIRTKAAQRRLLYLCSGYQRDWDAPAIARLIGASVDAIDLERHPTHDLADIHVWKDLSSALRSGFYHGLMMSPPCSTFSVARTAPGGDLPTVCVSREEFRRGEVAQVKLAFVSFR